MISEITHSCVQKINEIYDEFDRFAKTTRRFNEIEVRLARELTHVNGLGEAVSRIEYSWRLYPNVHDRCSAIVGHLSIMFAVAMGLFYHSMSEERNWLSFFAFWDIVIYVSLLLLSLRCMKSFGLDSDYLTDEMYEQAFAEEIVVKFLLIDWMNKGTFVGIVYSILLVLSAWII